MTTAKGSCLCGQYQYEFDQDVAGATLHCHCKDCRKVTGSGKATIIVVPEDQLKATGDLDTYQTTGFEGSHVTRAFCPTCGSQMISYVEEVPGVVFVKAGTLEDGSWVKPSVSFWSDTAEPWAPVDSLLPSVPKNPPPGSLQ